MTQEPGGQDPARGGGPEHGPFGGSHHRHRHRRRHRPDGPEGSGPRGPWQDPPRGPPHDRGRDDGPRGQPPRFPWRERRQGLAALLVLLVSLGALLAGAVAIFLPFTAPIVIASILTMVSYPAYAWVLGRIGEKRRGLASAITCILVLAVVFAPLTWVGWTVYEAAPRQMEAAAEKLKVWQRRLQEPDGLKGTLLVGWEDPLRKRVVPVLESIGSFLGAEDGAVPPPAGGTVAIDSRPVGGALRILGELVVKLCLMVFILFFFLKDGVQILAAIRRKIPLERGQQEKVIQAFTQVSRSIVRGTLLTAAVQGLVATAAYLVVGLPAVVGIPVLSCGVMTALAALVPGVGTSLVIVPFVVVLVLDGSSWWRPAFLAVAAVIVGLLDNVIKPRLLQESGLKIHSIWLLLSILGGINAFGPMGFFYGPLVLVLLGTFIALFVQAEREAVPPAAPAAAAAPAGGPPRAPGPGPAATGGP